MEEANCRGLNACPPGLPQAPANAGASNEEDHEAPGGSRLTHKACLERYRKASVAIMTLLRKLTPGVGCNLLPLKPSCQPRLTVTQASSLPWLHPVNIC